MPRYVIEREIPGAGRMTPDELRKASAHSNGVLENMGPDIEWVLSYVAGDKTYCIYDAPSEDRIQEHARLSGFPANKVTPLAAVIGPQTGK